MFRTTLSALYVGSVTQWCIAVPRRTQSNMLAALSQRGPLSKRPPPLPQHAGCKKGKASRCVLQVGVVVGGEVAHTHLASAHELSLPRRNTFGHDRGTFVYY